MTRSLFPMDTTDSIPPSSLDWDSCPSSSSTMSCPPPSHPASVNAGERTPHPRNSCHLRSKTLRSPSKSTSLATSIFHPIPSTYSSLSSKSPRTMPPSPPGRRWRAHHHLMWAMIIAVSLLITITEGKKSTTPSASTSPSSSSNGDHGAVSANSSKVHNLRCVDGLVLPVWRPVTNVSSGDVFARGLVYFLGLIYLFIGVSIVADRFMGAIEVITSQEKEVTITKPNGETQTISVRIWNETVSNLTLMALGSSAPEILLSIIEVYAMDYNAGDLGPGTIVGSAAFNLFVIIAICVWVIPSPGIKKIKHLRVFFVTMVWSVFAYIWLYAILTWSSYGVVTLGEGLLTFSFFPMTVATAYIADRRLLVYKYLSKKHKINKRGMIVGAEDDGGEDIEMGSPTKDSAHGVGRMSISGGHDMSDDEISEFEKNRMEYINILKDVRRKNPDASVEEIEQMARDEISNRGPKSRAFYRLQATKKLTGGTQQKKKLQTIEEKKEEDDVKKVNENEMIFFFDPGHYTVMENVGKFTVTVTREGDLSHPVDLEFNTEDGSANDGSDYEGFNGTITFHAGEAHKAVFLSVIDDDVFEEDEHFYARISNPRYVHPETNKKRPDLKLGVPAVATVMILDDDHGGIFSFPEDSVEVNESAGLYLLKVSRLSGARGKVFLPYRVVDGDAGDKEFILKNGEIEFGNNESTSEIPIQIVDNESYEKDCSFVIEIGEPIREEDRDGNDKTSMSSEDEKVALLGKPRLGDIIRCTVRIRESKDFKDTVDKLFITQKDSQEGGWSWDSWKDQFIEAITVQAGDDDEATGNEGEEEGAGGGGDGEGEEEEKMPSISDYVMHFVTLFWKIMFAFVPPPDLMNGWLCFVSAIIMIGVLTAVIGDLASHLGCTVGLKDTVTAIAFVALGTSVPDTFASKVAALNDQYADSCVGNVTGSNAVNVFLGIGIAWTLAAFVHKMRGTEFVVSPGSLAFSVTMFCICAAICCGTLLLRRKFLGGELGGPMKYKLPTTILFVGLWVFYVFMSSLEAYGVISF